MPPEVLRVVTESPADSLIATDFDGTLAPIVDDPGAAVPLPDAPDLLARLTETVGEVAVISGRPLSYLDRFLDPRLTLVGLYGLETRRDGERVDHPTVGAWRETVEEVASAARRNGPDDMRVELKSLSITLHYREHPEIAPAVERYAREAAESAGLSMRPARKSVELHPPVDEDKGTALRHLAARHSGPVVFIGDDVGDLAAFRALDELAATGRPVVRVAVDSPEMPPELAERADAIVDGPPGVVELLRSLLA